MWSYLCRWAHGHLTETCTSCVVGEKQTRGPNTPRGTWKWLWGQMDWPEEDSNLVTEKEKYNIWQLETPQTPACHHWSHESGRQCPRPGETGHAQERPERTEGHRLSVCDTQTLCKTSLNPGPTQDKDRWMGVRAGSIPNWPEELVTQNKQSLN